MKIDWEKWEEIERAQNKLNADVDYCKQRFEDATYNQRNAETSLMHAAQSNGVFRRADVAAWLQAARDNPAEVLENHRDHAIASLLQHYIATRTAKESAAESLARAEHVRNQHGQSYHRLRHWIQEQQSRGALA